ncbi:unnamed protein product [Arctogadus glacialis]
MQQDITQPDQIPENSSITDQHLHTPGSDEEQMGIDKDGAVTMQQDLTTHATAFVINARAKHRLSQKDMNDIVAGVQQYQSSLLDNLRRQMKDMNSVIRKQFSCVDAEEIPIAPTIIRKKRGGSRECLIKDKHELAGFKEGVGFAYSKCRHCECSFEDMQSQFNEDAYTKRTLEKHVRLCDEIEKANTDLLRNSLRTTYGINRRSNLNKGKDVEKLPSVYCKPLITLSLTLNVSQGFKCVLQGNQKTDTLTMRKSSSEVSCPVEPV